MLKTELKQLCALYKDNEDKLKIAIEAFKRIANPNSLNNWRGNLAKMTLEKIAPDHQAGTLNNAEAGANEEK